MNYTSPITERRAIESSISDAAFARISEIAAREAGIVLAQSKVSMVKSRLTRRLRALRISTFDAYLDYLETQGGPDEMSAFISSLTTNVSHFFRENHHFDFVATQLVPLFGAKLNAGGKVRIWSAGCSNGQEPYSIAMTLLNAMPSLAQKDLKILATDIDPEVLTNAKAGTYTGSLTTGLTPDTIEKFFTKSDVGGEETLTVRPEVRNLVSFKQLNLHSDWPMQGKFDVIFCRNVVIYFDEPTQEKLYRRFHAALASDGVIMLGHSERFSDAVAPLFESVGVTTYQLAGSPKRFANARTKFSEKKNGS